MQPQDFQVPAHTTGNANSEIDSVRTSPAGSDGSAAAPGVVMGDENSGHFPESPRHAAVEQTSEPSITQRYQHFRLSMIKLFGSMASALYELGMNAKTGLISASEFLDALTKQYRLLEDADARALFTHIVHSSCREASHEETASFVDFGISQQEWELVLQWKEDHQRGNCEFSPIQSPHPGSFGIFLCPQSPNASSPQWRRKSLQSQSVANARPKSASIGQSFRKYPWRSPQKPWEGSVFAGSREADSKKCQKLVLRKGSKECGLKPFNCGRRTSLLEQSKISKLARAERPKTAQDPGFTMSVCPPSREEMEPKLSLRRHSKWWPYAGRKPTQRLSTKGTRYIHPELGLT